MMGVLRLLLAFGVVRSHRVFFQDFWFIQGGSAVIFFYIISGFYMSLVISQKYQKSGCGWQFRFLFQRILRLYPAYWFVLAIAVVFYAFKGTPTSLTSSLGLTHMQHWGVVLSNLVLLGMDAWVSTATVVYAGRPDFNFLFNYFPVLQAWTVAVELTFYFFAAFFALRNKRSAMVALGIGVYFRVYFLFVNAKMIGLSRDGIGYSNTPWGYHFFGICIVFFMLGWVSYSLYVLINDRIKNGTSSRLSIKFGAAALSSAFLAILWRFDGLQSIADYNDYRLWLTIPVFVGLLPFAFILTSRSRLDNLIGQFSYPVYLCHVVAPDIASAVFGMPENNKWTTLTSVVVASMLIVFTIEMPGDRIRHRLDAYLEGRKRRELVDRTI